MNNQPTTPDKLTAEHLQEIVKDPTALQLMQNVFLTEAYYLTMCDTLQPVQDEIIEFFKFQPKDEKKERYKEKEPSIWWNGEYLTYKGLFLASEEDCKLFDKEYQKKCNEMGIKPQKEGNCPLLEAESLKRDATRHAMEYICPLIGFDFQQILYSLKNYRKIEEILKGLFAPFMNKNEILNLIK